MSNQPTPEKFFHAVSAYHQTAAIKTAIELDLFTTIAGGATDAASIAAKTQASERGIRILCDCLVVWGFLTKSGAAYGVTQDSAIFLTRNSPAYMGSAIEFMLSPHLTSRFEHLTSIVRTGTLPDLGSTAPDHPMWVNFARSMAPLTTMAAQEMAAMVKVSAAGPCKVLDIAAGHGTFGVTMGKANPAAQIYALDWANVLEVAKENAQAAGITDRFHTIAGSAFDVDYGTEYQIVLITNFLHHFDPPTNETFLRRVHAALAPGGVAVTLEFVPNDDRVTPPAAAAFSMTMLGSTPHGDAYTFRELDSMFHNAGFASSEVHPLANGFQTVIISRK